MVCRASENPPSAEPGFYDLGIPVGKPGASHFSVAPSCQNLIPNPYLLDGNVTSVSRHQSSGNQTIKPASAGGATPFVFRALTGEHLEGEPVGRHGRVVGNVDGGINRAALGFLHYFLVTAASASLSRREVALELGIVKTRNLLKRLTIFGFGDECDGV